MNSTATATAEQRQHAIVERHNERDAAIESIHEYLSLLRDHSAAMPEVREIRILGARDRDGRIDSGYFNDDAKAAQATGNHDYAHHPHGSYVTLNPCHPDCISKAANRIRDFVGKGKTTPDKEIVVRRWVPLDLDPNRLTGIPSTDAEFNSAICIRSKLRDWLRSEFVFPEMMECNSGNGGLALFPVDLPNDDASTELIRLFLLSCEQHRAKLKWGDGAKIDCTMFNAARISRQMGLPNRKGDSLPERPHRRAQLTFVPDYLRHGWCNPVSREQIEAVAKLAVDDKKKPKGKPSSNGTASGHTSNGSGRYSRRLNMEKWLGARGVEFNAIQESSGTRYDLPCVNHDDHIAAFFQAGDGTPGYNCFHDRCKNFRWAEASEKIGKPEAEHFDQIEKPASDTLEGSAWVPIEGECVRTKDRGNYGHVVSVAGSTIVVHFVSKAGNEAEIDYDLADLEPASGKSGEGESPRTPILRFTAREMTAAYPKLDDPVIDGMLRQREILNLISAPKIGKSWLLYYLLLCLATGRRIFDRFATTAGKILLIDNELPPSLIPYRIRTVAKALQIQPDEYLDSLHIWSLRHSPRSIFELPEEFLDIEPQTYQLVALDAKYKALAPDADENSNADEARFFAQAGVLAETTRSALLLVHHSTKGSQSNKSVVDVGSGASSQARACDTHLILREHEEPDCAVMQAALRSFEPMQPLGLRWEFPTWQVDGSLDTEELKGKKSEAEEKQKGRDADADQAVLGACDGWHSRSEIRSATGYGLDRVNRTLRRLIDAKYVESETQDRKGNPCEVFRKTIRAR